ncbi:MAG: cupredoxin domain-containing protein [Coriobacteriia bacterium]|nr:cupredoxin domain-containing protein [Coriobacteriia bacterium]
MTSQDTTNGSDIARWLIIGGLVVVAFFGVYKFAQSNRGRASVAQASSAPVPTSNSRTSATSAAGSVGSNSTTGGCACCGGSSAQASPNGVSGPAVEGTAKMAGGVQAINVTVTTVYAPNIIHLKVGVPAQITFSAAQGCTSRVQSQALGFAEDLSAGPKVVTIKNPQAGSYDFACGMNMVHGKIVVE